MGHNLHLVTWRIFVRPSRSIISQSPHITQGSNGQAERFVDMLKRALKKARGTPIEKALQQFLRIYRIMPNDNAPSSLLLAEVMFACKIRSVFNKLLPKQTEPGRKRYQPEHKVFSRYFVIINLSGEWVQLRKEKEIWSTYLKVPS